MKTLIEQARDMLRDIESMSSNAEEFLTIEDVEAKLIQIKSQVSYDLDRLSKVIYK